jgi:hypothetical protein
MIMLKKHMETSIMTTRMNDLGGVKRPNKAFHAPIFVVDGG